MAADGSIVFRVDADDKAAQKKLEQLRRSIEKTAKAVEASEGKRNGIAEALQTARAEAEKTAAEIKAIQEQMAENNSVLSGRSGDVDFEEFTARKQAQEEMAYELKQQEKLYAAQQKNVTKLETEEKKVLATLQQQTEQLKQQKAEAGAVERVIAEQNSAVMPKVKAATEQMNKSVQKGAKSILKWGIGIRSAFVLMRRLRSAIVEGVKAFAEHDAETKANIDGLKASLQTLKLSWGAAFAPILNAVAPLLQKLISWLTAAANAVASFFAILGGKSTYKRAIVNNGGLAESYEGAGKAAEEAEKQIMGFDEINKLNDNSSDGSGGGGGSGGGAGDTAYEEVPVDPKVLAFLEKCKAHLREIQILASEVGAALLAWKLSQLLPFSFKQIFGVLTTIIGAVVLVKEYLNAWTTGVSWDNFIGMLEGAALVILGLTLAFGTLGGVIGQLVIGVAFLVLGIKDWITTGELTEQTCALICMGLIMIGVALAGVTGGWSVIAMAALAAALLIYKNWDKIKTWWNEHVVPKFKEGGEELRQDWENIKTSVANLKKDVVEKWQNLKKEVTEAIDTLKTEAPEKWEEIKTKVVETVKGIWTDITGTWDNIKKDVLSKIDGMKTDIETKFEAVRTAISGIVDKIKGIFNFEWSFPKPKMPHFSVTWSDLGIIKIPNVSVNWYAKGGIFDQASLIGVGEAGREAVLPLDRNTGWINELADSIIDRITSGNRVADLISGMELPAVAQGQIVPPKAVSPISLLSDDDVDRIIDGIASAFSGISGGENELVPVNIDGRKVADIILPHMRRMNRGLNYGL